VVAVGFDAHSDARHPKEGRFSSHLPLIAQHFHANRPQPTPAFSAKLLDPASITEALPPLSARSERSSRQDITPV